MSFLCRLNDTIETCSHYTFQQQDPDLWEGRGEGPHSLAWGRSGDECADISPGLHWSSTVIEIETLGSQPKALVAEVCFL